MPINSSDVLEMLINSAWRLHRGPTTEADKDNFPDTYRALITALEVARIEYVLTGAMAYGLYARARATRSIDIVIRNDGRAKIENFVDGLGFHLVRNSDSELSFADKKSDIEINFLIAIGDPFHSAIKAPTHHMILGLDTLVITAEYLLWQYCLPDRPDRSDMAIELINADNVNLTLLRRYLVRGQ